MPRSDAANPAVGVNLVARSRGGQRPFPALEHPRSTARRQRVARSWRAKVLGLIPLHDPRISPTLAEALDCRAPPAKVDRVNFLVTVAHVEGCSRQTLPQLESSLMSARALKLRPTAHSVVTDCDSSYSSFSLREPLCSPLGEILPLSVLGTARDTLAH